MNVVLSRRHRHTHTHKERERERDEITSPVLLESIPDITVEIVVTTKEQTAAAGEGHR